MLSIARRVLLVVCLVAVPTGTAFATTVAAAVPLASHVEAPAADPAPPLAVPGDSSPIVKKMQKALIKVGLMPRRSADGFFGPTTEVAITQFQQLRGLTPNGTLDVPTAVVLKVIKATTILSKGARGEAVRVVQQQLLALGISIKAGADGIFGKSTVAALKTFQRSVGLPRSGKLDAGTAAILANAAAAAPPLAAAPPPAPVAPEAAVTSAVSIECAGLANAQRAAVGVAPLTVNASLTAAAEGHSAYQASITTMTHDGAGGVSAGARITNAGYVWRTWGENVAYGQLDCAAVIAAWMASPGHRANILNPAFTNIGVAVAVGANGYLYWTMDLGAPR